MLRKLAVVAFAVSACGPAPVKSEGQTPAAAEPRLKATIHWTSHAIPHVFADDLESLSFGQGYAFAELDACILLDQIVRIRGERSKYFGPGDSDENIVGDFGVLSLGYYETATELWPEASHETKEVTRGFVAGFNKRVAAGQLSPECDGADWVREITELDLAAYGLYLNTLGSSGFFIDSIGGAQPPASNAWAIGSDLTGGGAILVGNPHFPWEGANKFYESHLVIPGKLDAYGAALIGSPLINIGFNRHLGWSHTFSSSRRFAIYRLQLVDGSKTTYKYGLTTKELQGRVATIEVEMPDGTLEKRKRTLYRSHYGPVLVNANLPWSDKYVYSIKDTSFGQTDGIDQYLALMRASDLASFQAALAKYQGTPFVNTIYADDKGNAFYADTSLIPKMSDEGMGLFELARKAVPAVETAWQNGVIGLDGTRTSFEWIDDPKAAHPGVSPFGDAPKLVRKDYVANANQSYWATNPNALMTGYSPFYGDTEERLSGRTRMNLLLLREMKAPVTLDAAEAAILSNRTHTGELLRDAVVQRCRKMKSVKSANCDVLARWDGRLEVDSRGVALWRELVSAMIDAGWESWFAVPFDDRRPVDTPARLTPAPAKGPDPLETALLAALASLDKAGVAPDARLGDIQYFQKGDKRFEIHGGGRIDGTTNLVSFAPGRHLTRLPAMERGNVVNPRTGLTDRGYAINYGTSFLLLVQFTDHGPNARGILTYSNSSDPRSAHYSDQTELWQKKQLRPMRYTLLDIEGDPEHHIEVVTDP